MKNSKRRIVTGLLSGALGMSAVAQEPAAPAEPAKPAASAEKPAAPAAKPAAPAAKPAAPVADSFKAPDNVAAAPADAAKTASGLASMVLKKGTGTENPSATDTVKVHYTGWKASDGEMFDSSMQRGQPAEFQLNGVIKGWTEGVQLMVVGEKRRFWIPSELAYGDEGRVAGNLTFDVELLEIVKPPEAPKDLIAPADAVATESGLKSKILKAGEGDAFPSLEDVVTVHFSGWKADGEFLTSTAGQPRPAQFKLDELTIKGWAEGIQLMKKGEKRRMWVPAALAFGKEGEAPEGSPAGDLVFDFELIDFRTIPKPPPPPKAADAPGNVAAAPAGAAKTESGIPFVVLKAGEGEVSPKDGDLVKINFSGWDANGAAVGSNKDPRGGETQPMSVNLAQSPIAGWVDVLKGMKKGESRRVWIPENLTFAQKRPGAPEGPLTFDLELVEFKTPPAAPETPADVAAVPADATKMESGLAYKVLKKGTGAKKPGPTDKVKVHYAGWQASDGNLFDNSIQRDELFEVDMRGGVIKGWLEGLKVMVVGEKTRFWIPADMAYGDTPSRPGGPSGLLVFDIEVFEINTPVPPKRIEAVTPPIQVNPPKPKEAPKAEGEAKGE
ncbi:MAG: FKBP-type peptidyl-prolyl cis-trans isomerase [Paracoccaceae bacterium]|jgi:FKBP-type peptidyl-prolyl cis-trans isomerase